VRLVAVWALASAFGWFMACMTWNDRLGFRNPGVILGVMFLAGARLTFGLSFVVKPESGWRAMAGLDDETLKSSGR